MRSGRARRARCALRGLERPPGALGRDGLSRLQRLPRHLPRSRRCGAASDPLRRSDPGPGGGARHLRALAVHLRPRTRGAARRSAARPAARWPAGEVLVPIDLSVRSPLLTAGAWDSADGMAAAVRRRDGAMVRSAWGAVGGGAARRGRPARARSRRRRCTSAPTCSRRSACPSSRRSMRACSPSTIARSSSSRRRGLARRSCGSPGSPPRCAPARRSFAGSSSAPSAQWTTRICSRRTCTCSWRWWRPACRGGRSGAP